MEVLKKLLSRKLGIAIVAGVVLVIRPEVAWQAVVLGLGYMAANAYAKGK